MKKWGLISLVPLILLAVITADTYGYNRSHKVPTIDDDVKLGANAPMKSTRQLELQAASTSVSVGQTIVFTVTFKNGGTSAATLEAPCGNPFNLIVKANGQEVDDWLHQSYGGPPTCPSGSVKVLPGETYRTTLSLRFPMIGPLSVYAITLAGDTILSDEVMLDAGTPEIKAKAVTKASRWQQYTPVRLALTDYQGVTRFGVIKRHLPVEGITLWLLDTKITELRQILAVESPQEARISPSSRFVAFTNSKSSAVLVMDISTRKIRELWRVTSPGEALGGLTWSPDEQFLGVRLIGKKNRNGYYVLDLQGKSEPLQLTTLDLVEPDWDPTGDRIVYVTVGTSGKNQLEIFQFPTGWKPLQSYPKLTLAYLVSD
jgi:hypothetical protein